MMLLDMINKLGIGHGAWVTLFIVPAAHNGNDYRVADHHRRHQAKSPRVQESRPNTRRQDADQLNDTGEQRKLQAEEDNVVLLCRD